MIKHSWNGTVLTITSDSGTSSADLKGAQGETGIRGPQGYPGVITSVTGELDLSGYVTKEYLETILEGGASQEAQTAKLDFTNLANGSFRETLTDGTEILHTVTYNEEGKLSNIDGIEVVYNG